MNASRLQKLSDHLRTADLDWLALVPSTSLTYLTGIHGHLSERPFVVFLAADQPPAAIIPHLEAAKGESAGIPSGRIFAWRDEDGYAGAFEQAISTLGLAGKRVGVEALQMRVLERDLLTAATIVQADHLVADLRLRKDAAEIAAMQVAVDVAEQAITAFLPTIQIGMTEKQIAAGLTLALMTAGADKMTFDPIVSAGANAASPHAVPTERPIAAGDLLILDWGAQVGDYVSDITRTYAVGAISDHFANLHRIVQASNQAGRDACVPGATGESIDRAARDIIEQAGYGKNFFHRTGHGLGMEAHEHPSIVAGMVDPLPVGAAFTIEPGIYLPGVAGVRIEDDMVMTESGAVSLTTLDRTIQTIGHSA